jgi:acetyl esterase/lipase
VGALRWAAGGALAITLVGCSGSSGTPDAATSVSPSGAGAGSSAPAGSFDPAAVSQVFLPTSTPATGGKVPIVVLVPGGGWDTHDNTGLVPLAERLRDEGFVVVNTSYRAGQEGQRFPVPAQDVTCSVAYAARAAKDAGVGGGPVVVVGHSAGGHLAALAAVSDNALEAQCADPIPPIAGLVGLGGIYDTLAFEPNMTDFFGIAQADDPGLWEKGDPVAYAQLGEVPPGLKVLLISGENDTVVPSNQATTFASVLEDKAGIPVTLTVAKGADHLALFTPEVAAAPITDFVATLTP